VSFADFCIILHQIGKIQPKNELGDYLVKLIYLIAILTELIPNDRMVKKIL